MRTSEDSSDAMTGAPVELRVHEQRVILVSPISEVPGQPGTGGVDPATAGLAAELTAALHEWGRVVAALHSGGTGAPDSRIAGMVSRRGNQLAARVAETMATPVSYHDPVAGAMMTVRPAARRGPGPAMASLIGTPYRSAAVVPWLTGLTLALFSGVVLLVAVLALATAITGNVADWLAPIVTVVVTAGLAPSLWLVRALPIVRWVSLGAAVGLGCSWIGVAVLVS